LVGYEFGGHAFPLLIRYAEHWTLADSLDTELFSASASLFSFGLWECNLWGCKGNLQQKLSDQLPDVESYRHGGYQKNGAYEEFTGNENGVHDCFQQQEEGEEAKPDEKSTTEIVPRALFNLVLQASIELARRQINELAA